MCNDACVRFAEKALKDKEIRGRSVLEVGAKKVNGSLRELIELSRPQSYFGVDIEMGPGVDMLCDVNDLDRVLGGRQHDLVVCTELLEHVRNWRQAVSNLKGVLKPSGILLITTRSKGFHYHGYPEDYWRFEIDDFKSIFSDLKIKLLEQDPSCPGVFLKAVKPKNFAENRLDSFRVYSVIRRIKCRNTHAFESVVFNRIYAVLRAVYRWLFLETTFLRSCRTALARLFQVSPTLHHNQGHDNDR
jgi:SAM-dependent methyltransferase